MATEQVRCDGCRFWHDYGRPDQRPHGECRESPRPLLRSADFWCGRWQPRAAAPVNVSEQVLAERRHCLTVLDVAYRKLDLQFMDFTWIVDRIADPTKPLEG